MLFLRKFCNENEILKGRKWITKIVEHTIQNDGYNCGVFVCIFLKLFFEGKSLFFDCDENKMEKYRLSINAKLKENTSNSFCSICSFDIIEDDEFLKCNCFHKYHYKCIKDNDAIFVNCPQCF
jgi:hypothetical protein